MTAPDPAESTTADLIALIYDLQGTLKLLTEVLAQRHNPVSTKSWHFLSCSQHYLNHDLRRRLH